MKMWGLEGHPPITRHMRYALVQNQIVQNGEFKRKLSEIGREHKRKAGEILQGRSQAVRDHVINSYQSAQRQENNRRCSSRVSISRDRHIMFRLNELSDQYLLGSFEKTPFRFNSHTSAPRNSPTKQLFPHALKTENKTISKKIDSTKQRPAFIRARSLSDIPSWPSSQGANKKTNRRWTTISLDQVYKKPSSCSNSVGNTCRANSSISGKFAIRRRSGQFSDSSMAFLRLQNAQQMTRLDPSKQTPKWNASHYKRDATSFHNDHDSNRSNAPFPLLNEDKEGTSYFQIIPCKPRPVSQEPPTTTFKSKIETEEKEMKDFTGLKPNLKKTNKNKVQKYSVRWSDNLKSYQNINSR